MIVLTSLSSLPSALIFFAKARASTKKAARTWPQMNISAILVRGGTIAAALKKSTAPVWSEGALPSLLAGTGVASGPGLRVRDPPRAVKPHLTLSAAALKRT